MVDPPPFSTQQLKRMGVPSRLIDSVIISHCHGDHDAAILQKALDSHKVEVIKENKREKLIISIADHNKNHYGILCEEIRSNTQY